MGEKYTIIVVVAVETIGFKCAHIVAAEETIGASIIKGSVMGWEFWSCF